MDTRPPLPPFTAEEAAIKVRAAEDAGMAAIPPKSRGLYRGQSLAEPQ